MATLKQQLRRVANLLGCDLGISRTASDQKKALLLPESAAAPADERTYLYRVVVTDRNGQEVEVRIGELKYASPEPMPYGITRRRGKIPQDYTRIEILVGFDEGWCCMSMLHMYYDDQRLYWMIDYLRSDQFNPELVYMERRLDPEHTSQYNSIMANDPVCSVLAIQPELAHLLML